MAGQRLRTCSRKSTKGSYESVPSCVRLPHITTDSDNEIGVYKCGYTNSGALTSQSNTRKSNFVNNKSEATTHIDTTPAGYETGKVPAVFSSATHPAAPPAPM